MASSAELLRVYRLRKTFYGGPDPKTVLNDVSFVLSAHDSLAVVGPSGCGKTTLLLMVAGLLAPSEGSISLDGSVIKGPSRSVALVLQHYGLFPWKTVGANIALGANLRKIGISSDELTGIKKELGIEDLDHLYPVQLSGGQRQRVALARAILLRPSLLGSSGQGYSPAAQPSSARRALCCYRYHHQGASSEQASRDLHATTVRLHNRDSQL